MERIEIEWVKAEEYFDYLDGKGPKPKAVFIEEVETDEDIPMIDIDELID